MNVDSPDIQVKTPFRLDKWYLDFTGPEGGAMIFYSARMVWHGFALSYKSWLHHLPGKRMQIRSGFSRVQTPVRQDTSITWSDKDFGISGRWNALMPEIQARLFDDGAGSLQWKCYQPASAVELAIGPKTLTGKGYAEELTLTALPWHIPMEELRWGRFIEEKNNLVWIEIREKEIRQWVWLNGERTDPCRIGDAEITGLPGNRVLSLDRCVSLESEKKILSVAQKIGRYIPGFKKAIPLQFMLADEFKWFSRGQLSASGNTLVEGDAIHELVRFGGRDT